MPSRVYRYPAPFRKGLSKDASRFQQGMDTAYVLQDAAWPLGVTQKRGPLRRAGSSAPTGDSADVIYGAMVWERPDGSRPLVVTYRDDSASNYKVATIPSGSYDYGDTGTTVDSASIATLPYQAYPLTVYGGEVILGSRSAVGDPLVRYSGVADDATAETGTVAIEADGDFITGSGTNFLSTLTAGSYIVLSSTTYGSLYYLVTNVQSDTIVQIGARADVTETLVSWSCSGTGRFNLHSIVTEGGQVSSAPSTTVTGYATEWDTGGSFYNAIVTGGELIGRTAEGAATETRVVQSVASDTSLTVTAAPSGAWTTDNYRITRNLCGPVVAVHAGRLWAARTSASNDRIQVLPAGYDMAAAVNGIDSPLTAAIQSRTVESFELAGDGSPGEIVALVSTPEPGPLVALKTDDAFLVYGEWPNTSVTKLGRRYGCLDSVWPSGAACAAPEGVFWAGPENVYRYTGGAPDALMSGRIARSWQAAIRAGTITNARVASINGYLFVSTDSASHQYVLDIGSGAWSLWSNFQIDYASEDAYNADFRDVYVCDGGRVYTLACTVDGSTSSGTSAGDFSLETGDMLTGNLEDWFRVTHVKVTYELYPASARVTVGFGDSSFTTAATLSGVAEGSAPTLQTTRIPVGSSGLGARVRHLRMKLDESVAADKFLVHEVSLQARSFRWRS